MLHNIRVAEGRERHPDTGPMPTDAPALERILHERILDYCKHHGWRCIHARMDRATTIGEGTCDFVIFADAGKVWLVECKSATGKLSIEQNVFIAWLAKLGHTVYVIRSYSDFLKLVNP